MELAWLIDKLMSVDKVQAGVLVYILDYADWLAAWLNAWLGEAIGETVENWWTDRRTD